MSEFSRETLLNIIETDHVQCGEASALARMALAAMDSEPVRNPVLTYADSYRDMTKQGVESVPIWSVITDLERNIAPLYRHAQQAPASEPVYQYWCYTTVENSEGDPEEFWFWKDCEKDFYDRWENAKRTLYKTPQPALVVPPEQHWEELCRQHPDMSIGDAIIRAAWWNHCRAAMPQAKSLYSINPAPDLVSLQKKAESIIGNYPGIPDGSENCPCCGKKLRRACSVEGCGGKHVAHGLCQKHYDMKRWEDPEQVERFREADRRYRGKKKTTVTTPQEPKP
ncbi:hypothetical protein RAG39_03075 [Klebsiella quasipneumoniae subsp. quasipneumoniae]|uniref:hypothetical protein n=1 Tax=Klebsiella quasipneumoniae TaxID=1463165 RepID=UPI0030056639